MLQTELTLPASLLVLGARAVLNAAASRSDAISRWAVKLVERRRY